MKTTRFYQATERVPATGEESGALIINLDHVVAVDRVGGALRVITTVSGVTMTIHASCERSFLDALTTWWAVLDRFVGDRVLPGPQDEAP
mgnify:CR=1 FL=1